MNQLIIQQAASQLGVKEIAGEQHNKTIVQYSHDIGLNWVNDDETSWCAIFVYWVLWKCGYLITASASARSLENYGQPVVSPEPGDIVVFWRDSPNSGLGHVGFFLGFSPDGKYIYVLGGNQGNACSISRFGISNVTAYRRATETHGTLEIPEPTLSKGDTGEGVKKLQAILLYLNIYSKKIDGDFGVTKRLSFVMPKKFAEPTSSIFVCVAGSR